MQKTMRSVQESITASLHDALAPAMATALEDADIADVAQKITQQLATSDAMKELSRAWSKSLIETAPFKPETLAAPRAAHRAAPDA